MNMNTIGEKKFLAELLPTLKKHSSFVNGFGDDASILDIGLDDLALAMKIDRAGKPIAALNGWTDYKMWGRLAVTANCSDILAIGARPLGFMISVNVPGDMNSEIVRDIILGAQEECFENDIAFLGGDTKESSEPQVIGAAIGICKKTNILSRRAGSPGDVLLLAGLIGGYVAGYSSLVSGACDDQQAADVVNYLSHPRARWLEANHLNTTPGANAATDLSDGLFDALVSIAGAGGTAIYLDHLPYHSFIDIEAKSALGRFAQALGVGDWGILYAIPPDRLPSVLDSAPIKSSLQVIGHITSGNSCIGFGSDFQAAYQVNGYINENFRQRMEDQGEYFTKWKLNDLLVPIGDPSRYGEDIDLARKILRLSHA